MMSHTRLSIRNVTDRIIASPAPVLFIDTCSLLDLIRVPFRERSAKKVSQVLDAAMNLIALSQKSVSGLWVVGPPVVLDEWTEHSQAATEELRRHLERLDNSIEIAHIVANAVGAAMPNPAARYSSQNLDDALERLSASFFANALILSEDSNCVIRASRRTINQEAPGRKGGGLKDCIIIEHSIELCSQLQVAGFAERCVFITSNEKDFFKPALAEAKAPLDSQLRRVGLSLTKYWNWAKTELGF